MGYKTFLEFVEGKLKRGPVQGQSKPGPSWTEVPNDFEKSQGVKAGDRREWFDEKFYRIPDSQLAETGLRKDNRGIWYNKETRETKQIYSLDEEAGEKWTREATLNEPFHKWDEKKKKWIVDTEKKEVSDLEGKIGELRSEISSRDWKVTKAQRLKKDVDEIYPGETAWYNDAIEQINALEQQLEEMKKIA